MPFKLDTGDPGFEPAFAALLAAKRETAADVDAAVAAIIDDVATRGDAALIEYTDRFDRVALTPDRLRLAPAEIAAGADAAPRDTLAALELAAERIERFHCKQLPTEIDYVDAEGVRLGQRWRPLAAAGLYVPGGTAAYPSSVLMNAIPARVAGVERLVMTVPAPDGVLNPLVLAAARLAGIDEIYRVGGAQAVAALACGTATIAPVDKIVGPGNAYVAAAKRRVFGRVGIDMIAGPSEILVVAGADNDPAWIAADLLSQAEHDDAAQAILISDDSDFITAVEREIGRHLQRLPRADTARASWQQNGAMIRVADWREAAVLIDRIAPEHLELAIDDPEALAGQIRHAGAIFLGRHTPEAIGDYIAGPNHVLPTARSARFASGLGVLDFMKRTTIVGCDEASLAQLAPAAIRLAEAEGLDAHALSLAIRLPRVAEATQRIAEITLDERTVVRRSPEIERERAAAIADLVSSNHFSPASGLTGPFQVHLATADGRLAIEVASKDDSARETVALPLRPFARIVKDYFLVCESYAKAVQGANLAQVEAIDMGRRGLHDEGARLLSDSLAGKITLDHATARRLFTLICVLHLKAAAHGFGAHPRS